MISRINKGDRVAVSREFLRNNGIYTGDTPFQRGVAESVEPFGERHLVTVHWDGEPVPSKFLDVNLVRVEEIPLEHY